MNCTPFVGQYGTLFKKWGVFRFQREYRLKATPFGQQKGGRTASENAVQPPKFYILIIAYNF